jgi:hypothetical protein
MSIRVGIYDRSHIFLLKSGIRPESRLLTEVGHATGVAHTTGVASFNQSGTYDRSCVIQPESGLLTRVGHATGVVRYLHYKHV